jgi:hypothetical protein
MVRTERRSGTIEGHEEVPSMAYNRRHARQVLTDAEYELFTDSLSDRVRDLTDRELSSAITRTRRARDKHRDQFQRQSGETRAASGARAAAHGRNDRTRQKAQLFAEALERLGTESDRRARAAERSERAERIAAARPAGAPNRAARRAARKDPAPSRPDAAAKSVRAEPTTKHISAHRAAAGRRNQSRRDSR